MLVANNQIVDTVMCAYEQEENRELKKGELSIPIAVLVDAPRHFGVTQTEFAVIECMLTRKDKAITIMALSNSKELSVAEYNITKRKLGTIFYVQHYRIVDSTNQYARGKRCGKQRVSGDEQRDSSRAKERE